MDYKENFITLQEAAFKLVIESLEINMQLNEDKCRTKEALVCALEIALNMPSKEIYNQKRSELRNSFTDILGLKDAEALIQIIDYVQELMHPSDHSIIKGINPKMNNRSMLLSLKHQFGLSRQDELPILTFTEQQFPEIKDRLAKFVRESIISRIEEYKLHRHLHLLEYTINKFLKPLENLKNEFCKMKDNASNNIPLNLEKLDKWTNF